MTLYFAYGSNMDRSAMKRRCPGARAVGRAVLDDYRFFVGIAALHAYELLHQGLYDVRYLPVRHGSRRVRAMIYLLRRRATGMAKPGYVERIALAAREWNLPEPYVRSVERWSNSRYTGARAIDREIARE
jgi:hypothetical protein